MAQQDPAQLATDLVTAFNNNDWEACRQNLSSDSIYDEVGTSRKLEGVETIIDALQGWKQAMPDVKGAVGSAISTGNTAVLEVTWTGTQTGPLEGPGGTIAPTGKQQITRSGWVLECDSCRVTQSRHYFDMLSFMQQLGQL